MTLPTRNLLADEASPYLLQHASNPVHWRSWSPAALAEAKALDRPILLSVGYAACHWCHVMAHESFENADVAAVMNRLFVNIKVDREERPDIDQIYMAALSAMGEQGGWPLTMFLTPYGKPFWGGTYFPPEPRYGRPGFIQALNAVDKAWREKKQSLDESADGLTAHVADRLAASSPKMSLSRDALATLSQSVLGMIDKLAGGLRGAPKFPNAPFMHSLWLAWLQNGDPNCREAVIASLQKMFAGGIYDHIGGGLSRYSTDAEWLVPHFEKMLYDNAQLLRLCNWAFAETGLELFRIRIEETVTWLLREMRPEGAAFAASLDADSEGEEGLFYTWSEQEITQALGDDDEQVFPDYFSLARPDAWEGKPVICQSTAQQERSIRETGRAGRIKERLLADRGKRSRPGRDGKILTDWNGLAITALAECGRSLDRSDWIEAAEAAFRQIASREQGGRLPHSTLAAKKLIPALSSDYAAMANAAASLFEATGRPAYIDQALAWLEQLDRWHLDETGTGHYLTAADSNDVLMRIRGDVDEAIPSATAQILEAMTRAASLSGDAALEERTRIAAEHAAGRAATQGYGQAGMINACALAIDPMKLVLVDTIDNPVLVPVANRNPDPRRVDIILAVGTEANRIALPGGILLPVDRVGAYLCMGQTCLPVITDPAELEAQLQRRG